MNSEKMFKAAQRALREVFRISSSDKVLALYDKHCSDIAGSFLKAAGSKGCKISSYEIKEKDRPLKEIPQELLDLLKDKTLVLNILKAFPEEVNFRIKWLFKIEEDKKARCAHMPGITEEMITAGSLNVDYKSMRNTAAALINLLKNAEQLHITSEVGTDLKLGIDKRPFTDDVHVKPGGMCNLPCGEIYCAPEETKGDGVVVFDASIGDIGLLNSPLKVHLRNGRIIRFESDDKNLLSRIMKLSSVDEDAMIIGELGIGINTGARITGIMLEDEKAINTAHIAFGNNEDFPGGGKNHSKIHRDYLFYKPTIEVVYKNKPGRLLIDRGKFVL
jgi:aminopeptidase